MNQAEFVLSELNGKIKDAIGGFTGVKDVKLSAEKKSLLIDYDPKLITVKKIKDGIEFQGCRVSEVKQ